MTVIQYIMDDRPIQPIIQPVTIDTMLKNNGVNIGDGLIFVTCEQTFILYCAFNFGPFLGLSLIWSNKRKEIKSGCTLIYNLYWSKYW